MKRINKTETDFKFREQTSGYQQGEGGGGKRGRGARQGQEIKRFRLCNKCLSYKYVLYCTGKQSLFYNTVKWSMIHKNIEFLCCTPEMNIL